MANCQAKTRQKGLRGNVKRWIRGKSPAFLGTHIKGKGRENLICYDQFQSWIIWKTPDMK